MAAFTEKPTPLFPPSHGGNDPHLKRANALRCAAERSEHPQTVGGFEAAHQWRKGSLPLHPDYPLKPDPCFLGFHP